MKTHFQFGSTNEFGHNDILIDFHPTETEKVFNVLLALIEVKLIFHGISIRGQTAHQAKLMPFKKLSVIFGISVRACFSRVTRDRGDTVSHIIRDVKTLYVGLTTNKQMVGEYEDVSKKKHAELVLTEALILKFKLFVF